MLCTLLVKRNCYLVETVNAITALVGSNTAAYLLGSVEASIAAAFYLIDYITKADFPISTFAKVNHCNYNFVLNAKSYIGQSCP